MVIFVPYLFLHRTQLNFSELILNYQIICYY
nr:MAG TPA: hypothetical protein [Caudoviricetes sp.]